VKVQSVFAKADLLVGV